MQAEYERKLKKEAMRSLDTQNDNEPEGLDNRYLSGPQHETMDERMPDPVKN